MKIKIMDNLLDTDDIIFISKVCKANSYSSFKVILKLEYNFELNFSIYENEIEDIENFGEIWRLLQTYIKIQKIRNELEKFWNFNRETIIIE